MVFCSKSVSASPRRCRSISPARRRPDSGICSILRQCELDFESRDYMVSMGSPGGSGPSSLRKFPSLGSLPRRDVKILEAMARKKEDEIIRQELADKFRELWTREKNERKQLESYAECQYQKFVQEKREWERQWSEQRQQQRDMEHHLERSRLAQDIREREERSAHLLELLEDEKLARLWSRRVEDASRRRHAELCRAGVLRAEERRRHTDAAEQERRADAAERRRRVALRDASQRTAITNSICQLESARLQREAAIADLLRHEQLRGAISEKEARVRGLARARQEALRRARRTARLTAALREAFR